MIKELLSLAKAIDENERDNIFTVNLRFIFPFISFFSWCLYTSAPWNIHSGYKYFRWRT